MGELIKIEVRNGQQLASGRELHKFLEVGTRYDTWINRIIEKYNFIENKDFIVVAQKRASNEIKWYTEFDDHFMTIAMAKEIAMVANTEKGKEARIYFIKCEEAWNSPEMILARANQIQSHMIEDYTKKIEFLEMAAKDEKTFKVADEKTGETEEIIVLDDGMVVNGETGEVIEEPKEDKKGAYDDTIAQNLFKDNK